MKGVVQCGRDAAAKRVRRCTVASRRRGERGTVNGRPRKLRAISGRTPREESEEDRATRLHLVPIPYQGEPKRLRQVFTGKATINKDGLIAIDRYNRADLRKDWEKRRKVPAPPPGGWPKPPSHWPRQGVRVDLGSVAPWLPKGWGQGIKTTCVTKLQAFVSPEGKVYYHKHVVEQVLGRKATGDGVKDWQQKWDKFRAKWEHNLVQENLEQVKEWVTKQIKAGRNFMGKRSDFGAEDRRLFRNLTKAEAGFLPKSADELHFAVISARRASDARSLRVLCNVQAQLTAGGASPVWYVDGPSLPAYRRLGLRAKLGGKLVPARNLALADAKRLGKACVQVSDDIQGWTYYAGNLNARAFREAASLLQGGNEAARHSDALQVSAAAAARFLLAKLRAAGGPRLAGVFPVGNSGMALTRDSVSTGAFILGDFFVADLSPCRFDPRMSLKEDYDFTCTHLARHGAVLRCNRMLVHALHETNAGGAVSERDTSGRKERANIKILQEKWPGVFHLNGRRGDTQVIMSWGRRRS